MMLSSINIVWKRATNGRPYGVALKICVGCVGRREVVYTVQNVDVCR